MSIEVRAGAATVTSQTAVSMGLVVTELVINALKHAFPEGRKGHVVVTHEADAAGWRLSVRDDGIGRPLHPAAQSGGLGTVVVEGIAKQLGAVVAISDAGPGALITLESKKGAEIATKVTALEYAK